MSENESIVEAATGAQTALKETGKLVSIVIDEVGSCTTGTNRYGGRNA